MDLDRELLLGLEFQAAATRLVGGLPSAETFGRLLALEQEVSRGETAAERSLLAMMAVVFAATTARTADEVAALAEAAWGDGQLLVEVRSEHPALAAPATTIALTAATVAIALTGRLTRAIEVWTAGVEEGRARSSMLLYSNSLGLRASARAWSGDLGGAEADAVAALALLPADDPIVRPAALSALTDVHIEHGALDAGGGAAARRLADRRAAADAEHQPGAGLPRPARPADGRSGRRPDRSRGGRPAIAGASHT